MASDVPRYDRGIDPIPSPQLLDTLDMDTATNLDDVFVVHNPTSRDKTHSRLTRGCGRLGVEIRIRGQLTLVREPMEPANTMQTFRPRAVFATMILVAAAA